MRYTASELAEIIGATLVGNPNAVAESLCTVHDVQPDSVFPILKMRYAFALSENQIALTTPQIAGTGVLGNAGTMLVHPVELVALVKLIDLFFPEPRHRFGIHPTASIAPNADLHPGVSIGANAVIEDDVSIDEGTVIGPGAIICRNSVIGRFVHIGPGAVIGHEGFGFFPSTHTIMKIPQVGGVEIGDFVEIGANSCVDRGTVGCTRIGFGTKIDNLVQVGHNVRIGENVIIAAQVGLAGSVMVDDNVMIGGQAGVADHLYIGKRARVGAKSGVIGDVKSDETVAGYPAMNRWQWLRILARIRRREK